jgi:FAD/FMN-containing dehydrogenase
MQLARLEEIVGAGNIETGPPVLERFARDISFVNSIKPRCIVRPGNTSDVEKIVVLARETGTPLVPVSSGEPHFRGDTVPSIGGAVIVDLSGMKKILHVDRKNRVSMFEAGVTFGELIPGIAEHGLRLNMPLLPRTSKSVAGSLLEREPVIMPKYHWDIADPLACMEIVFGTGDMFRTGSAAGSGTIEEQWAAGGAQKEAAGPSSLSWYRLIQGSQGTMGVVTWVSARCELLPALEEPYFIAADDINGLLEMVHWLVRLRLVNECFILNNTNLAMIMAGNGEADYRSLKDSLPRWVLFYNIASYDYLPEERMAGQLKDVAELAGRIGVAPVKEMAGLAAADFLSLIKQPSREPYWKIRRRGACQEIFPLTVFDDLQRMIAAVDDTANTSGYPASEIGVYLQPVVQGVNWHCEFDLFYDNADPEESVKVRALSDKMVHNLVSQGAFFSRPYGNSARMIMNRDAASVEVFKKVKAVLDPDNIMNPGKLCF